MLHAAAHAKSPVPARAASNLKVFTDALDELRERARSDAVTDPRGRGPRRAPRGVDGVVFTGSSGMCAASLCPSTCVAPRGDGVLCASTPPETRPPPSTGRHRRDAIDAPPSTRRPRRAAVDA